MAPGVKPGCSTFACLRGGNPEVEWVLSTNRTLPVTPHDCGDEYRICILEFSEPEAHVSSASQNPTTAAVTLRIASFRAFASPCPACWISVTSRYLLSMSVVLSVDCLSITKISTFSAADLASLRTLSSASPMVEALFRHATMTARSAQFMAYHHVQVCQIPRSTSIDTSRHQVPHCEGDSESRQSPVRARKAAGGA